MDNVIKEMTLKINNLKTELKEIKSVINKTEITETEAVQMISKSERTSNEDKSKTHELPNSLWKGKCNMKGNVKL